MQGKDHFLPYHGSVSCCTRATVWCFRWHSDTSHLTTAYKIRHNLCPFFSLFVKYVSEVCTTYKNKSRIQKSTAGTWQDGKRGSWVSIVTDQRLCDQVESPVGQTIFLLASVQTGCGAHPASYPVCTVGPFHRGKARLGRDADHLPPFCAEVKKEQRLHLLLSPSAFTAYTGDSFAFPHRITLSIPVSHPSRFIIVIPLFGAV
jgi:hypothetical protein